MAQSENPNPKMHLPDLWATKMACPVCSSAPLGVFHPTGQADRFACSSCETSFELEDAGKRVRFITLPKDVTPWMRGQWVVLEEALAAFEVFKNGQANIKVDEAQTNGTPDTSQSAETDQAQTQHAPVDATPSEISSTQHDPSKLVRADRLTIPKKDTSPFYPEDVSRIEEAANQTLAPKLEAEKEFWETLEAERDKGISAEPMSDGITGTPKPEEIDPPKEPELAAAIEGIVEIEPQPESPAKSNDLPQTSWPEKPSISENASVEVLSFDNLPPIRPLEDTPPTLIQPPQMPARTRLNSVDENLGDLRSHISFASNAPSETERIQSATERAIELQRLGNTDREVRSILERSSGLTPEQVAEVLKNLEKPEEKKRSYRMLLTFSIVAIILFTLLAWWFLTSQSFYASPIETQSTQPGISLTGKLVEATNLPVQLQTLMPNGLQIFNEEPSVEKSTETEIPAAPCPGTKGNAAELFGGPVNDWIRDENARGWSLVTKTQGVVIRIPANMSGGYLVFEKGPEMRGVNGPAIVRNIYMIAISCE